MLLVGVKNSRTALENNLVTSYKVNIHIPYEPVVPFLGHYPKEMKKDLYKNVHSS